MLCPICYYFFFFFNDTATTEIYTLSLHDALPILWGLLSLVVVWLGRRFQVDRANFGRHFFIHLGASLDIALLQLVAAVGIQDLVHAAVGRPYPFAQKLVDDFTLYFHWNVLIYWAILAVVHWA